MKKGQKENLIVENLDANFTEKVLNEEELTKELNEKTLITKTLMAEKELSDETGEKFKIMYVKLKKPFRENPEDKSYHKAGNFIYGIEIRKLIHNRLVSEIDYNISDTEAHADFIINYLANHNVTIITAAEIIDWAYDLYEEFS